MKHAGEATLDRLEPLLERIRHFSPPLKEKKRGTFYLKSSAFLHFHEDGPAPEPDIYADIKINGDWVRHRVTSADEWDGLLADVERQI